MRVLLNPSSQRNNETPLQISFIFLDPNSENLIVHPNLPPLYIVELSSCATFSALMIPNANINAIKVESWSASLVSPLPRPTRQGSTWS